MRLYYCPVAVTPHLTTKVAVVLAAKVGDICKPVDCCKADMLGLAGHILAAVEVQVTLVQLKPVTAGSVNTVPGAAVGPRLATVMV